MQTACPQCGSIAAAVRNQHYGVDLSVHEFLIDCSACGQVSFIEEPHEHPVEPTEPHASRFWSALQQLVHRNKALPPS